MANTITKQTLVDGDRKLVVLINILGDGTGEETDYTLIDASSYTPAFTDASVSILHANLVGFIARLEWDATADSPLVTVADYESHYLSDEMRRLKIPNPKASGYSGDILMTTVGLGANDSGTIILEINKKST